jgi:hypothetical protein
MLPKHPRNSPHPHSLTSLTPHTSAFRCPIALLSYHPNPTHESSAPRRQLDGGVPAAADRRDGGRVRPERRGALRRRCCCAVLVAARPAGACRRSRQRASSRQAPSPVDTARTPPWRRSAVSGVRCPPSGSSSGPQLSSRLGSGPSGVRTPGFVVRVRRSGRLLSTPPASSPLPSKRPVSSPPRCPPGRWPAGRCPAGCGPPPAGPLASVCSHLWRWRWDQAEAAGQPVTTATGRGRCGGRTVGWLGRQPSSPGAGGAAELVRWSVGVGGGPGRVGRAGAAGARCAARQAGPAHGAPARGGAVGQRSRPGAIWPQRPGGCRRGAGWTTTLSGGCGAARRAGHPPGVPAGVGVRPQRGPSWQRAFPAGCRQRYELRGWVVGLPGLEPGTSSLSGMFAGCVHAAGARGARSATGCQ